MPRRGGHHWNLAKLVNQQLEEESDPPHSTGHRGSAPRSTTRQHQDIPDALQLVANKVSAKLEEGDFRGAVRLACSGDSIAEVNNSTIGTLRSKHPVAHPDTSLPSAPKEEALEAALEMSAREVSQAIRSFPRGSAGGP